MSSAKETAMIQPMPQPGLEIRAKSKSQSVARSSLHQPIPPPSAFHRAAPTHSDIAQRAYDIYTHSHFHEGRCVQNWLQAEQDLREQGAIACNAEHRKNDVFAPDATDTL
jgi:hypothetical protein